MHALASQSRSPRRLPPARAVMACPRRAARSATRNGPHGVRTTEDWQYNDEGYKGFYPEFSSNCARCREHQLECISREVARDACAAAVAEHNENVMATVGAAVGVHLAVGPDGQDPPDPYGTESADCFYEKLRSDAGARRLSGGLCFALPDEVYGAGKHAGPSEPERKRGSTSGTEFPEPDWAPWTTVKSESGGHKTVGKSSTYYVNYDAAAHTAFRRWRTQHLAIPSSANPRSIAGLTTCPSTRRLYRHLPTYRRHLSKRSHSSRRPSAASTGRAYAAAAPSAASTLSGMSVRQVRHLRARSRSRTRSSIR